MDRLDVSDMGGGAHSFCRGRADFVLPDPVPSARVHARAHHAYGRHGGVSDSTNEHGQAQSLPAPRVRRRSPRHHPRHLACVPHDTPYAAAAGAGASGRPGRRSAGPSAAGPHHQPRRRARLVDPRDLPPVLVHRRGGATIHWERGKSPEKGSVAAGRTPTRRRRLVFIATGSTVAAQLAQNVPELRPWSAPHDVGVVGAPMDLDNIPITCEGVHRF